MNLALVPLLIAALLMASSDPTVETVELVLSGTHEITEQRGALVVGEAQVRIPSDDQVSGPIYVVGGELVVAGRVDTDVVQLAGTVKVEPGAEIAGELQHIGGTQRVSAISKVGQRTGLGDNNPVAGSPIARFASLVVLTLIVAGVGRSLARRRISALDHVAGAIGSHPIITLTVGTLLTLTFISVFVFMAFTIILLPVAIIGLLAGAVTLAYGLIAWGNLIGDRLPVQHRDLSTAIGVVIAMVALQLLTLLPVVGDLIALAILLTGVGAVTVTYFGVTDFKPDVMLDEG